MQLALQYQLRQTYLIYRNFQNKERKVTISFSQYQVLESIRLNMQKAILILINLA